VAQDINQMSNRTNELILSINYSIENFEELDEILSSLKDVKLIVIMNAPQWMVSIKKKKWENHIVINSGHMPTALLKQKTILLSKRGDKYIKFTEVLEYLNYLKNNL